MPYVRDVFASIWEDYAKTILTVHLTKKICHDLLQ